MMKSFIFVLCLFFYFSLYSQSSDLSIELTEKTGLKRDHFLIQGFSGVNRGDYVPDEFREIASTALDIPLRPHVLALSAVTWIDLLLKAGLEENDRVLLAGEECAYGAAALSRAGMEVYLIDPSAPAASSYQLKKDLSNLKGWISMAPFDFILLLNTPQESVPQQLIDQLSSGGILIVPLISSSNKQDWIKIVSRGDNMEISLIDGAYPFPLF